MLGKQILVRLPMPVEKLPLGAPKEGRMNKNKGIFLAFFVIVMMAFVGCGDGAEQDPVSGSGALHETEVQVPKGDLVEISERLFIAQSNDIYINTPDYMGKTIKYEGLFKTEYWEEEDTTYAYVIRYGPGCCGYDGEAGFELEWDGPLPEEDEWCEVMGTPEVYEDGGIEYLRLKVTSLQVLEKRGAEYVST